MRMVIVFLTFAALSVHAGSGNVIDLEVRSNNMYYGPIFIGSEYWQEKVIYDTASQWVTINNMGIPNAELISNYDILDSDTAK